MRIGIGRALALSLTLLALGAAGCGEKSEEAATNPPEPAGFQVVGRWSGELTQKGLKPFRVDAEIGSLDDPRKNTVHYTGIDCSGNWTYQGRHNAAYRFREVIDRGKGGKCKGVGTVTLTPVSKDEVDYEFRGGGVESRGVLSRGAAKSGGNGASKKKDKGGGEKKKRSSDSGGGKKSAGSDKPSKKDIGVTSDADVPDTSCTYTDDC